MLAFLLVLYISQYKIKFKISLLQENIRPVCEVTQDCRPRPVKIWAVL